jgi:hypothetical protein
MSPDNPDVARPRCACGQGTRLLGIEWETEDHDLYTFICEACVDTSILSVPARPDNTNLKG